MPQQPSGRISINNLNCTVTPKLHMLLDPTNSNGLRMENLHQVQILHSSYQLLRETESLLPTDIVPCILSIEEIASLDPSQRVKKVIQVRFHHHLLPFKLAVLCNGKKYLTKLWPDIGYFLRPLSMSLNAFIEKEQQLPRMFEYSKSGEILSNSRPCLVTTSAEGKFYEPLGITVKINCEDTVFSPNLLNRVAAFLQ
ncbi:hypothetical protein C4D60_Mb07t14280 [Musa balbisiana]|uniref:Uncharacterized protein n=1 Tax=Musa balbisiana TaxID=52838 RepID=A0A4S8JFG6_MUSBA|nr:hypothetical protein C4D60_Mb07t14280 [Musa balbisiana]